MQDDQTTQLKPITALRDALYRLDNTNDLIRAAENVLQEEKQKFQAQLRSLGPLWVQAAVAAERIGEQIPEAFREGGLLITLDEDGIAQAERLPVAADQWRLLDLAEKSGEKAAK